MFPRVTTFRRGDKVYKHLRIVESYRENGKVKQKLVASLGSLDSFTETDVDNIINGLCRIFERPAPGAAPELEAAPAYGHVHALVHLWRELKLTQILAREARRSRHQFDLEAHLKALVINRLTAPSSKLELLVWLETVFIPGVDREEVEYHHLLRAMDWLIEHKDGIEKQLANEVLTLFDQELDVVFYDLTSSYFETELTDELRKYGYSRDHRSDRPQVTIGLVTTRDGIPIAHEVFPGHTVDKATVRDVVRKLCLNYPIRRAVFVGDRGLLTRDNIAVLKAEGLDYIVATRIRRDRDVAELLDEFAYDVDDARPGWEAERQRYQETGELPEGCETERELHQGQRLYHEAVINGRRLVAEHSEQVARYSARQRHKRLQRTEDGLEIVLGKLEAQDEGKPSRGRPLSESGALLQLHELAKKNRVRSYYQLVIEDGYLVVKIDDAGLALEAELDGKLVVETSLEELSAEEVIRQYRDLRRIEDAFRELKSSVRLRPMHHWTPNRIKAHVFVCVLALVIERVMRLRLRRAGHTMRPSRVLKRLSSLRALLARTAHGEARGLTRASAEQLALYEALGVPAPTLKDVI